MMLRASRYGDGAELLDESGRDGYGLAAEALGLEAAETPITRAEAAGLLYGFMDR